jgi:hypothetical protein
VPAIDQFISALLPAKNVTLTKLMPGFKNRSSDAFKV